jgi:hypothetical protein
MSQFDACLWRLLSPVYFAVSGSGSMSSGLHISPTVSSVM